MELLAIFYGLASAACWGAGDFSGGVASKGNSARTVVIISQVFGIAFLILLALLLQETIPPESSLAWGAAAGLAGAVGLVALYRGLAGGRMGVVAPIGAVVAAVIPVVAGALLEGLPGPTALAGFGVALLAVWLLSRGGERQRLRARDLQLAVTAGAGFGFFYILIGQAGSEAVLWPLVAARVASITFLLLLIRAMGGTLRSPPGQLPIIALAGIFDTGGNAFFVLAAQAGRLDVAAILSSLYPATTALLAWLLLRERLAGWQWMGVALAVAAVLLITA